MILVNVTADIFTIEALKNFYLSIGFSKVVITTAENHDSMIAFTSQLCHIVSNAYIKSQTAKEHHGFSAGSYRDLTRVARLNAKMWSELMTDNSDKLVDELYVLIENLNKYKKALENKDEKELYNLLEEGNNLKLEIDSGRK
jgi:prephenate dehydrogenase